MGRPITIALGLCLAGCWSPRPPQIDFEQQAVDFGSVQVGSSATRSVRVHNLGGSVLHVDEVRAELAGGACGSNPFSVVTRTPLEIRPERRRFVEIAFRPTNEGSAIFSGQLLLVSDDPTEPRVTLPLTGESIPRG